MESHHTKRTGLYLAMVLAIVMILLPFDAAAEVNVMVPVDCDDNCGILVTEYDGHVTIQLGDYGEFNISTITDENGETAILGFVTNESEPDEHWYTVPLEDWSNGTVIPMDGWPDGDYINLPRQGWPRGEVVKIPYQGWPRQGWPRQGWPRFVIGEIIE